MKILKKITAILLSLTFLLTLASCEKQIDMPKKQLPDYPSISENGGYTISGTVLDTKQEPLGGVSILVNGKILTTTDEKGEYEIPALKGINEVTVSFYDYVFKNPTLTVNNSNDKVDFVGSSNFGITTTSVLATGVQLFGVSYKIGEETKSADINTGVAYNLNNIGRTTVTPSKAGFTFYPSSQVVYDEGPVVTFLAVPNSDTITVSGSLNFIDGYLGENFMIYVNGSAYTKSTISSFNGVQKAVFNITGLPPTDENVYVISAGSGSAGYKSIVSAHASGDKYGLVLDMIKCKSVSVTLDFETKDAPKKMEYKVILKNEYGEVIDEQKVSNSVNAGTFIVWEGCSIIVDEIYSEDDFFVTRKVISEAFMNSINKKISLDCVYA